MLTIGKGVTEFKKDMSFGGTGGGRLRQPCRDCRHYSARDERCMHPAALQFHILKDEAPYKGCKKGFEAKHD